MTTPDGQLGSRQKGVKDRGFALWLVGLSAVSWLVYWAVTKDGPENRPAPDSPLQPIKVSAPTRGVRTEVLEAIGNSPEITPQDQLDRVRNLPGDLNEEEREALLAVLAAKRSPNTPAGWHSEFVHEIALALQKEAEGKDRFARVLATVAADASRDEVVRDYALQHLRLLWKSAGNAGGLRVSIVATFRKLAQDDSVLSASALLSLHLLGTGPGDEFVGGTGLQSLKASPSYELPDKEIEPVVAAILSSPPSAGNTKSRMTAMRIVRDRKLSSHVASVGEIAGDSAEHALVRMAAISALAVIEGPSARQRLESLDQSDPRIETAVRHALARLR